MSALGVLANRLRGALRRGRIVSTKLNAKRALVQLTSLADDTRDGIELFLPYGLSARPAGGADVLLLQLGASPSHLVALFADDPALRIQDLAEGEFGFRDRDGQQIVFRGDRIEITTPKKIVVNGSEFDLTGDAKMANDLTVDGQTSFGGGAKAVALDQDMVVGGKVKSSATTIKAS